MHNQPIQKVKIFIDLKPIDWISFNQIYTPIIGIKTANIYLYIHCQKHIFNQLNILNYKLDTLLSNLSLSFAEFKQHIKDLENLKLAKISINNSDDSYVEYIVKLFSPLSIKSALESKSISSKLSKAVSADKFDEISLLTENNDLGYDLDLSLHYELEEETQDTIENSVFYDFYDGVFSKTAKEFQVSDEILKHVNRCVVLQNSIPMKKLHEIAFMSMKPSDKGLYVCEKLFVYLMNAELNKPPTSITHLPAVKEVGEVCKYVSFWSNLLDHSISASNKEFNKLFANASTIDFYQQLTGKLKVPPGIINWINNSAKNRGFGFDILNAMLSFVQVWLQKMPVKYLATMSDSLYEDGIFEVENFLNHIREVITHDLSKKNRLNIKLSYSEFQLS